MADTIKKVVGVATIDCEMVTIKPAGGTIEYILNTASKVEVEPQVETTEAVKLMSKGVLKAQKPEKQTITGNKLTLTDNVFTYEVVKAMQGGTITYDATDTDKVTKYVPPTPGDTTVIPAFETCIYSAQYDAGGNIVNYEKVAYPNCKGAPIAPSAEDDKFRESEYTINSYPSSSEAPYSIEYVDALPVPTA